MTYSIIRFEKIKTNSELTALAGHNLRLKISHERNETIDPNRLQCNKVLKDSFGVKRSSDLQKKLNEFYKGLGVKPKEDSVLAIDFMVTTSPEFWGDWKNELNTPSMIAKINDWAKTQIEFLEKEMGKDAVKFAVLHLDETTPHIHILVTPEQEKEVTVKNKHGVYTKVKHVLNAKRWNPAFYKDLVTKYADANAVYGLQRGKEGSNVEHKPLKEYKTQLASELNRQKRITDAYVRSIEDHDASKHLIAQLSRENQKLKKENAELQRQIALAKASENQKNHVIKDEDLDALGL